MIRTGFIRWHNQASDEERKKGTFGNHQLIGVEASEETVRWLYDQHFAALVGDTVAFEAWPPQRDSKWTLHDWALVWWGTPLGEMWDLEGWSRECEKHQRWTFMVTSAPLHVKGGVGSPTASHCNLLSFYTRSVLNTETFEQTNPFVTFSTIMISRCYRGSD